VGDGERSLAVFIDFENLALGFQGRRDRFDISRVIERLVEKGKIVAKKAYADWNRFSQYTASLHEAAIELVEIPRRGQSGKNSADIRLCVDAMDLAYSKEHINTFVVVSGDSDFSPLVSKLKELGKHVIGLGMQESTSDLLRDNCDEFIYYEDLHSPGASPELTAEVSSHLPENKRKAFALLLESLMALRRENKEVLWSSMIKDTMKRKKPSFNETYHGYRTFSELLEDAQKEGILELETDKRSRTYVVTRFGAESKDEAAPTVKKKRRRRSKKKNHAGEATNGAPPLSTGTHPPAEEGLPAPESRFPEETEPAASVEEGRTEEVPVTPRPPPEVPPQAEEILDTEISFSRGPHIWPEKTAPSPAPEQPRAEPKPRERETRPTRPPAAEKPPSDRQPRVETPRRPAPPPAREKEPEPEPRRRPSRTTDVIPKTTPEEAVAPPQEPETVEPAEKPKPRRRSRSKRPKAASSGEEQAADTPPADQDAPPE
jgi:uncharacterized protein (TIGR00288 family)